MKREIGQTYGCEKGCVLVISFYQGQVCNTKLTLTMIIALYHHFEKRLVLFRVKPCYICTISIYLLDILFIVFLYPSLLEHHHQLMLARTLRLQ